MVTVAGPSPKKGLDGLSNKNTSCCRENWIYTSNYTTVTEMIHIPYLCMLLILLSPGVPGKAGSLLHKSKSKYCHILLNSNLFYERFQVSTNQVTLRLARDMTWIRYEQRDRFALECFAVRG